jgi:tRNA(fMet)-specific endonuclease VapC
MTLRLSVDTTFLIDLLRDRSAANDDGAAHRFLKRSPEAELFLSTIALREFVEGFDRAEHPIVTANVGHFRRMDGLGIVQYR